MTGFRLPPLVVDYNQLWLEAELRGTGDGRGWARRAAAELLSRPQWARFRTRRGERSLIALLGQAAVIARKRQDASMGLILIPSPEEGVKGMAAFCRGKSRPWRPRQARVGVGGCVTLLVRVLSGPWGSTSAICGSSRSAGPP
jgi:hypothetical protein